MKSEKFLHSKIKARRLEQETKKSPDDDPQNEQESKTKGQDDSASNAVNHQ